VKLDKYVSGVKDQGIRDWVVRRRGYGMVRTIWRSVSLVLTFPFFLAGFITSALPYLLPAYLVRNVKDLQFHSSLKAGLGFLLLFPLIYVLETLAFGLISGFPWWAWITFLLVLLPIGKVALIWYLRLKKTIRGAWFRRQLLRNKPEVIKLVGLRKVIIEKTAQLVCK
jgi:MFS family permease